MTESERGGAPAGWQQRFVDRLQSLTLDVGLPPATLRVFAWLIVCEPEEQNVEQLRASLQLSTGAISTATALLVRIGLAERITKPGDRRHYYRFGPDGWQRVLRQRLEITALVRKTADVALQESSGPQPRLTTMRDFYRWFEDHMDEMLRAVSPVSRNTGQ